MKAIKIILKSGKEIDEGVISEGDYQKLYEKSRDYIWISVDGEVMVRVNEIAAFRIRQTYRNR